MSSQLHSLLQAVHAEMHACARHFRFSLNPPRQVSQGAHLGRGSGHSVEFYDHRQYFPGDDPRHIDWQAYARTDQYSVKLYRKESSPRIDFVFDFSRSMAFSEARKRRMLELLYFGCESCRHSGVSFRAACVTGALVQPLANEALLSYQLPLDSEAMSTEATAPDLTPVVWRTGALRVFVSDLLFSGQPELWLKHLTVSHGRSILLVPYLPDEVNPDWRGQIEFVDCETGSKQRQLVLDATLQRYREAYSTHFALWREAAARCGVTFARIDVAEPFLRSLETEALPSGAVEVRQ